jgi:hypothetical protein
MKIKLLFVLSPLFLIITACSDSTKTKDWYIQHDQERTARVAECRNDAREGSKPDCANALEADASIFLYGKDINDNTSPNLLPDKH